MVELRNIYYARSYFDKNNLNYLVDAYRAQIIYKLLPFNVMVATTDDNSKVLAEEFSKRVRNLFGTDEVRKALQ